MRDAARGELRAAAMGASDAGKRTERNAPEAKISCVVFVIVSAVIDVPGSQIVTNGKKRFDTGHVRY
jgi:hypothetical protein